MFCDQKCKNEARERSHNIECVAMETLYGNERLQHLQQSDRYRMTATMVAILSESLQVFGSIEQLRALLEPKPDATIFDFDLSSTDWKERQKAELQLFHTLKPDKDAVFEKHGKIFATSIIKSKSFDKFIKSEEDRKFLIHYTVKSGLKHSYHGFTSASVDDRGEIGVFPFGSYFNHSCDENVTHTLIDNKIVFVVLKPIAEGEQLFINYDASA
jgi:hypothetical protein